MQGIETSKEVLTLNRITKKRILELCRKDKLYQTPELNDVLYLHYQGFDCIECLEDYTELKCLWLECNAISEIQGLDKQTKLKCLFLQSNLIRKIENLENCQDLDTLNLSHNHIKTIENCGIKVLPALNTLNLASNYLKDYEDLKELANCRNLSVLDLSNNRIDDILVVKIFALMPELKVLVLLGNPLVSKIPQYRKTLILECKKLTYLDSRPVFPKDRSCAEAWKRGGYKEERRENERWNRKERKKMRDSVNATIHMRNKNRKLEDQIFLIPTSSDSDDEPNQKKEKKHLKKIPVTTDTTMDCIWDEVNENTNSEGLLISGKRVDSRNNVNDDGVDTIKYHHKAENLIRDKSYTEHESLINSGLVETQDFREPNQSSPDTNQITKAVDNLTETEDLFSAKQIPNLKTTASNDDYEPLKELEEAMNIFSQEVTCEQSLCTQIKPKVEIIVQEVVTEKECEQINEQQNTNFNEFTTNLGEFVNHLEIEQNEAVAAKESSSENSTSEDDAQMQIEKFKLDQKIDQWDNETKLKMTDIEMPKIMMNKETGGTLNENEQELHEVQFNDEEGDEFLLGTGIQTKESLKNSCEYIPMDISQLTRKSNEALSILEKESKELARLLKKLENNNDELFKDVNFEQQYPKEENENCKEQELKMSESKKSEEKSIPENFTDSTKHSSHHTDDDTANDLQQFTKTIIDEVLNFLDVKDLNQKLYKFPNDLTKYDTPAEQSQASAKSITEVTQSFKEFLNKIVIKDQNKRKTCFTEFDKEKSQILKELTQQPNLKEFNSDTAESLNAQIEIIKRNQHKKVRGLVDRVYKQKDRYNDTLELMDNKLMVRNKDTAELRELPRPSLQQNQDVNEDDYDTADSGGEQETNIGKNLKIKQTPTPKCHSKSILGRKSSEDLVTQALIKNKLNTSSNNIDEMDESDDEFFSLEGGKHNYLYNIDQEFFQKLTFDFSNLTEIDETHIAQCAKSYEELKHCLTLSEQERNVIEAENELMENVAKGNLVTVKENFENPLQVLQTAKMNLESETGQQQQHSEQGANLPLEKESSGDNGCKIDLTNIFEIKNIEQDEEVKNKFENNIDFENCKDDNSKEILEDECEKENFTDEKILQKFRDSCEVKILECNLEIIGDNDEIVDTINVNAEIRF